MGRCAHKRLSLLSQPANEILLARMQFGQPFGKLLRSQPVSQKWVTRFDPSLALPSTTQMTLVKTRNCCRSRGDNAPIRMVAAAGANGYQVQISQDSGFASSSVDTQVPYPAFSLTGKPGAAQPGSPGLWHVLLASTRLVDGSPLGDWSEAWRFQLASRASGGLHAHWGMPPTSYKSCLPT